MDIPDITSWIERWEGRRTHVYIDSAGHPTIGVGFNLDRGDAASALAALGLAHDKVKNGTQDLTNAQIDTLLAADVQTAITGARADVTNFDDLPAPVQKAVVDMVFNMGKKGFAAFKKAIAALKAKNFSTAADEMEDSTWFDQVGPRAVADVALVRPVTI